MRSLARALIALLALAGGAPTQEATPVPEAPPPAPADASPAAPYGEAWPAPTGRSVWLVERLRLLDHRRMAYFERLDAKRARYRDAIAMQKTAIRRRWRVERRAAATAERDAFIRLCNDPRAHEPNPDGAYARALEESAFRLYDRALDLWRELRPHERGQLDALDRKLAVALHAYDLKADAAEKAFAIYRERLIAALADEQRRATPRSD